MTAFEMRFSVCVQTCALPIFFADNVRLVADGGNVDVAGASDTSGISGGDIALFGRSGVVLRPGSVLDAHADGYAATDSRQATGGDVTLGTDDSGVISVESGAAIDVGAHRPGDRLVRMERNGETFYSFVAGDKGGTLNLRAPVIEQHGADSVNVGFAGVVNGGRPIVLEEIGRASGRGRVCPYVSYAVVVVSLKNKQKVDITVYSK